MSEEKSIEPEKTKRLDKFESNVIFVGKKPVMNYVIAGLTAFARADGKNVCIKARGRSISTAVDTVEVLRRSFIRDLKIVEIKIGTEEVTREQRKSNVSTIEIVVARSGLGK